MHVCIPRYIKESGHQAWSLQDLASGSGWEAMSPTCINVTLLACSKNYKQTIWLITVEEKMYVAYCMYIWSVYKDNTDNGANYVH
jgi:hypothetical protein